MVQNFLDSDGEQEYEFTDTGLTLTNKNIKVSNKLLMMGMSDKRDDNTKRGQFGVGSCQAMVVLIDLGISVVIENNSVQWQPEFEYCPQFDADIMVINETPCNNGSDFTVIIDGLSPEDIEEVKQRCLVFQDREVLFSTEYGDIIENPTDNGGGEVFCGDMYVCQNSSFRYSYNFKPKGIKLSQDRDAVSQWELQALTSKLIVATGDNNFIKEAIRERSVDTQSVNTQWSCDPKTDSELDDELAEEFLSKNGAKYVTSSYDDHQTQEKLGNKSIYIQNEKEVNAIKRSGLYKEAILNVDMVEAVPFTEQLADLLDNMEGLLQDNHLLHGERGEDIISILEIIRDKIDNEDFD